MSTTTTTTLNKTVVRTSVQDSSSSNMGTLETTIDVNTTSGSSSGTVKMGHSLALFEVTDSGSLLKLKEVAAAATAHFQAVTAALGN